MIRIHRRPEPSALATRRKRSLNDVTTAATNLTRYDAAGVKLALYEAQHKKCAFCERRRDFSSSPVEHYRPKHGAWRNLPGEPRQRSADHYWWLTWTWENLLFSCQRCNDTGHKANYFPLAPGSPEAAVPVDAATLAAVDLTIEQPLLLDPAADTFLDHVRWEPSQCHLARQLWIWTPRGLTARGDATIAILKLEELADELQRHLVDDVLSHVVQLEGHVLGGRAVEAAATWDHLRSLLLPDRDFTAAVWCALGYWVDDARRAEWGLAPLPRPA